MHEIAGSPSSIPSGRTLEMGCAAQGASISSKLYKHGRVPANKQKPSQRVEGLVRCVEPISKSSEEDNEAGELDKAEEVLSVVLPADEDATLPLYPGEEALDEPASHVTA